MEPTKIYQFEFENVKRIKAVKVKPAANGLTIIGGKNNQGKTSVLDSIAWALGGNKYKPSEPKRDDSVIPPALHIVLSNGLIVERKGKNSDLKVIDPNGAKAGQELLNEFIETFALDLPKFMESSSKEKAKILLNIIGIGDTLFELERKEKEIYNERLTIGRIADNKKKYAEEQVYYTDAPRDLVSPKELVMKHQEILARNGENQKKRDLVIHYNAERNKWANKVDQLRTQLDEALMQLKQAESDLTTASKTAEQLHDESTEELEKSIANIDEINRKVRANLDKEKAEEDAKEYASQYNYLTSQLDNIRKEMELLLNNAELPLDDLSISEGELIYKGHKWDNMSGSDRLKVSTAIVKKLNPKCGFVLLDKLEQMDMDTLNEFGEWLESEGLQAIATRVSTGDECSIIIEDGYSVECEENKTDNDKPLWKAGEF